MRYFLAMVVIGACFGLIGGGLYGAQFGFGPGVTMFFFILLFWLAFSGILSLMIRLLDWAADGKRRRSF